MTSTQYTVPLVRLYQPAVKSHASSANRYHCSLPIELKLLQLLLGSVSSHHSAFFNWINELIEVCRYECTSGERSSAVEHPVHIGVVTGSIPVAPTTPRKFPTAIIDQQRFEAVRPKRIAGLRPESFTFSH